MKCRVSGLRKTSNSPSLHSLNGSDQKNFSNVDGCRQTSPSHTNVNPFHSLFLIAWQVDGDSLVYYIVMMGRQIAKMFSTFSLRISVSHDNGRSLAFSALSKLKAVINKPRIIITT